jgi:hypothetical protein
MPIAPLAAPLARLTPNFLAYALGWEVRDYAGAKVVMHGGSAAGFNSMIVLVPGRQAGFAVLMNAEHGAAIQSIVYELLDRVLDQPRHDWVSAFREARERNFDQAQRELAVVAQVRNARSTPSLPLESYAGGYRDPWYGLIEIRKHDGGLQIEFKQTPGMLGELEHWQFDTFRTRWRDRTIEDAFVTFSLDAEGNIARVDMRAVSPLADFSFDYQDLTLTPIDRNKP